MGRRVDVDLLALGQHLAGQRVDLGDPLDLVAEELDPDEAVLRGGLELERVAPDAEAGPLDGRVVALVLEVDEVAQDRVAPVLAADPQVEHRRPVVDRRAEAVDAADAGHDDDVATLEEGVGRGVAQLVDLVVAAGVLLDVRVGAGQVRLGLVVVEVAHEVLDRVVREERAELGVQLGRQRLVVGQDERRLVVPGDRVGSVNVLPEPVTPSSVWWRSPRASPSDSRSMAAGWSPVGSKSATSWKSGMLEGYTIRREQNRCSDTMDHAAPGTSGTSP